MSEELLDIILKSITIPVVVGLGLTILGLILTINSIRYHKTHTKPLLDRLDNFLIKKEIFESRYLNTISNKFHAASKLLDRIIRIADDEIKNETEIQLSKKTLSINTLISQIITIKNENYIMMNEIEIKPTILHDIIGLNIILDGLVGVIQEYIKYNSTYLGLFDYIKSDYDEFKQLEKNFGITTKNIYSSFGKK